MTTASSLPAHGGPRGPLSNFSVVGKTLLSLTICPQCHLPFLAQQTITNHQPNAKHCAQSPVPRPHSLMQNSAKHTGVGDQSSGDSEGPSVESGVGVILRRGDAQTGI